MEVRRLRQLCHIYKCNVQVPVNTIQYLLISPEIGSSESTTNKTTIYNKKFYKKYYIINFCYNNDYILMGTFQCIVPFLEH